MKTTKVDRPLIDRRFTINDRYVLTECINPDGTSEFWIMDREVRESSATRLPAHEHLGPLPQDVADRVAGIHHCGAPTSTNHGQPCRNTVLAPGNRCRWHDKKPTQPTLDLDMGVCAE